VRGERAISDYTDQAGNPISRDRMIAMVCESMLANVIAFEEAGVPRCATAPARPSFPSAFWALA
jgi:hypothetical protein